MTRSQSNHDDADDALAAEWESDPGRAPEPEASTRTTACSTAPGRTLLVEEGNSDGWLSSDLAVDISEYR